MRKLFSLAMLAVLALAGCARWTSVAGVDNGWRAEEVPEWVSGQTTDQEVLDALGPPSQIIALENETVFYYLRERKVGRGTVTLIYNWGGTDTVYDRAIFFFDANGVLAKHSYSREALAHEAVQ